jgi:hypothetical protein
MNSTSTHGQVFGLVEKLALPSSCYMRYFVGVLILIGLISCERINSQYYLSHRKSGILYRSHHYRLFKMEEDSIRIWILSHDFNGGYYSWKESHAVPRKVGKFGIIEFTDIKENSIRCKITEGTIEYDLGRLYPVDEKDAHEVLNILKMSQIDYEMENYIKEVAKCADPNTYYISSNYSADEKCSELNPSDFEVYYSNKMREKALEAIGKIDNEGCLKP